MSKIIVNIKKSKVANIYRILRDNVKYQRNKSIYEKQKIKVNVMSIQETIQKICDNNMSVVRFGDGEMNLIGKKNISFQMYDGRLSKCLKEIVSTKEDNFLVCIPDTFTSLDRYVRRSQIYWTNHIVKNIDTYSILNESYEYGNAFISRPYMIFKDKKSANFSFELMKNIWKDKDIVIIEGELSRNGIGNDLFNNAKNIERIVCPSVNAFDKIDKIINETKKIDKQKLILVALGPAAKPLVYDLYKRGYQAIDIGHIDSEYEWFLAKATKKIALKNKHSAELTDNREIEVCNSKVYHDQIIAKIN